MKTVNEMNAGSLKVKVFETRGEMGAAAADEAVCTIKKLFLEKNTINMIFAAAPSQNEFLQNLIKADIDFSRINAFHMDEYTGLDGDAPQCFSNFLKVHLFSKVSFKTVNYIDSSASDPVEECKRYARLLRQYPVDIVCMGIGENGHIAFNDPPVADFNDTELVKLVKLDEICRRQQVNDGCFEKIDLVPTHAMTLTIPSLINATHIFCVVPAKTKSAAVYDTINGSIDESCPASILRTHSSAVLYLDKDSAGEIIDLRQEG